MKRRWCEGLHRAKPAARMQVCHAHSRQGVLGPAKPELARVPQPGLVIKGIEPQRKQQAVHKQLREHNVASHTRLGDMHACPSK